MSGVFVGLLALLASCQRTPSTDRYIVQSGRVAGLQPNTGELMLTPFTGQPNSETLYCIVTKDSEIYINDRFSVLEEINIGDVVDLIGYRDMSPPLERFIVTYAYVRQMRPGPVVPPAGVDRAPTSASDGRDS